jgi:3-isopropylmalate/(R)-2-methylmalate dehydratase small subunit
MAQFTALTSRLIPLLNNNIDTDQIIPARFLKATDKTGMGDHLFADWRYEADGSPKPDFALNQQRYRGAMILLAGDNFGCGSSREHAPWALMGYGFRAVISTSFADIFRGNALKNGLLPVAVTPEAHRFLHELVDHNPSAEVTIDLAKQHVETPDHRSFPFPIDGFSRSCLLNGVDELGYLLRHMEKIEAFERHRQQPWGTP